MEKQTNTQKIEHIKEMVDTMDRRISLLENTQNLTVEVKETMFKNNMLLEQHLEQHEREEGQGRFKTQNKITITAISLTGIIGIAGLIINLIK